MRIITCASGKGGSGRSSTVLALAVHAFREKHKTAIVDFDPGQGVLTRWSAMRDKPGPEIIDAGPDLKRDLHRLRSSGVEYVFVDTEPAVDHASRVEGAIALCDLCLMPVQPSFFDVTSIGAVLEMCRDHDRPYAIVLVNFDDRKLWKTTVDNATKLLGKIGKGQVLKQTLTHRPAYVNALMKGLTGGEINGDAKAETHLLWNEVLEMLESLPERGRRG